MREVKSGGALRAQIRLAREEDLPALLALEEICFKEETFHKRQLEYLLLKAKSLVLIASVEGRMIGSMIILLRTRISHARIYSLNVHPEYRRRRLGSLMMDACERLLREKGFKKLTLEVGVDNFAAQKLYHSKGFSLEKDLRKYYKNGGDALRLIKKL